MTNVSAVSPPKDQNARSRVSAVCQASDVEEVIEKIECLRLAWDSKASKPCGASDHRSRQGSTKDDEDIGNHDQDVHDDDDEEDEEERREEKDEDSDELVERGPIKSQFSSPTRCEPYWTSAKDSRLVEINDALAIDYEKTAEQILQDKECSEKMNACLDQLENFQDVSWACSNGDKQVAVGHRNDLAGDLALTSTIVGGNSYDELLLLENVLCGAFQAAQHATENSFSTSPQSPPEESSRRIETSFSFSPVASPTHTVSSAYRTSQVLPYSSSSSSSCSNHSFGDTPSPNGSNLTGFSLPGNCESAVRREQPDGEVVDANGGGVVDNDDLWSKVLEELVNGLDGGEKTKQSDARREENAAALQGSLADSTSEGVVAESASSWLNPASERIRNEKAAVNTALIPCYPEENGEQCCGNAATQLDFSLLFHSFGSVSPTENTTAINGLGFGEMKSKKSITDTQDDFAIPRMVASFESRPRRRCNSDRSIIPWPSLNLPSVNASDRLKEKLNPWEVEKAMIGLLKRPVEELAKPDKDGDTMLMCLVGNPDELVQKMAYLVPLVERLSAIPGALTATNDRGEDALYLAALNCPQFPYVTGYLAATMLEKGIDVSQRLYHTRGDTLIHAVAAQGDSHGEILAELLALRTIQGNAVFDLSKRNYDGRTTLHTAVEANAPTTRGTATVATVKLLLDHGADPRIKETKSGDTALHMAISLGCDPALVKILLDNRPYDLVNAINYNHDTALHVAAAASNSVPLDRLRETCQLLVQAGGSSNLPNRQGKTPLALVSAERKNVIRRIFYRRS